MTEQTGRTVTSTRVEMSEVMTPGHANFLGKVFGGSILSLIDLCAYTTASRFSGEVCVTASFDRVDFHEPIEVGEFVTMVGMVSYAGRTSVEVTIQVFAEDIRKRGRRHTNTARVTMVAVREGTPVRVPALICETKEEKQKYLEGKLRRELRALQGRQVKDYAERLLTLSETELDTWLVAPNLEVLRARLANPENLGD